MTCPNCGATLTCGCQKKTASDGTQCCQNCVGKYEQSIKKTSETKLVITGINRG